MKYAWGFFILCVLGSALVFGQSFVEPPSGDGGGGTGTSGAATNAIAAVMTNGVAVTSAAATNLDFIESFSIEARATNNPAGKSSYQPHVKTNQTLLSLEVTSRFTNDAPARFLDNVTIVTPGDLFVQSDVFAGAITVTNFTDRNITNITGTTPTIDWNGRQVIRLAPGGTFTASFTNVPAAAATPGRSIQVAVLTADTGTFQNIGPLTIDWGADAGPIFISGVTNRFYFEFTGSNIVAFNGQEYTSGTGATARTNAPTLNNVTLLGTTTANVVSNLANHLFAIQQPAITASNLALTLRTNNFQCRGLTNIILTNWSGLVEGVNAKVKVAIENTLGVSVPIVWPAKGAQHGLYKFHTNGLNDVLIATVAPPGTNTIASFEVDGTNIYGSVTYWPR